MSLSGKSAIKLRNSSMQQHDFIVVLSREKAAFEGAVVALQDDAAPPPGYNCGFYCCHDALSNITEKRKACMPYDGTLDFPVLFIVTAMNLVALIYGTVNLAREGEIISLRGTEEQNVKMIALVFALVEVTPGFLFLWYVHLIPSALPCMCLSLVSCFSCSALQSKALICYTCHLVTCCASVQVYGVIPMLQMDVMDCGAFHHHTGGSAGCIYRNSGRTAVHHNCSWYQLAAARMHTVQV